MFFRMLGKAVWFTGKMTVKHILVPIAITAGVAIVLEKLARRLDESGKPSNGEVVSTRARRVRPVRET